jgi:hypothetical protein
MRNENRVARGVWSWLVMAVGVIALLSVPARVSAQNMADYTNYPIFLSQTVPPNILFLVDMGNATLEAAYTGTNQRYWISFKAGTAPDAKYSANVTVDSLSVTISSQRTTMEWRSIRRA